MTSHPLGGLLCFALYAAARKATHAHRDQLAALGLTYTQLLVLLSLWAEDGRSVTSLGQCLQLDSGTLSPLLRRMEQAGFITRSRDAGDERVRTVHLTDQGRATREPVQALHAEQFQDTGMTADELETLRRLAQRFAGLDAAPPAPPQKKENR